jgi:hypothetical protein
MLRQAQHDKAQCVKAIAILQDNLKTAWPFEKVYRCVCNSSTGAQQSNGASQPVPGRSTAAGYQTNKLSLTAITML